MTKVLNTTRGAGFADRVMERIGNEYPGIRWHEKDRRLFLPIPFRKSHVTFRRFLRMYPQNDGFNYVEVHVSDDQTAGDADGEISWTEETCRQMMIERMREIYIRLNEYGVIVRRIDQFTLECLITRELATVWAKKIKTTKFLTDPAAPPKYEYREPRPVAKSSTAIKRIFRERPE